MKLKFFLSLIFFFSVAATAQAATVLDTTITTTGNCGAMTSQIASWSFDYYTQPFTHTANNVNKVTVNFLSKNPQKTIGFYICKGVPVGDYSDATCTGLGQFVAGNESIVIASSTGVYNWTPPSTIVLAPSFDYFLSITSGTGFQAQVYYNGLVGNYCYAYNISHPMSGWTPSYLNSLNKSLYFANYYNDEYQNPPNLHVQLGDPAEGATIFSNDIVGHEFTGFYRDDTRQADTIVLKIVNTTVNQSVIKSFSLASTTVATGTRTFGGSGSDVVTDMNYYMGGTGTWTAWLATSGVQISSDTPVNHFTYSSTTDPFFEAPWFSTTTLCSTDDNFVFCSLKQAMSWAFYPSRGSLDSMTNSWNGFKQSFPFNVYFQLTDAITNTISSTTISASTSIGIPMIDMNKHIYITPFITASSVPNAIGANNNTLLRNTFIWLVWVIVALIIFFEIKRI